jgi:carbon-monoxide dehydrogenase small subunit
VLKDGVSIKACTTLAAQVDACHITTIEGLGQDALHPVQVAFAQCHALQCGFCTPGMIMSSVDLLNKNPNPTDEDIMLALEGNLCRCTGYVNIVAAVKAAASQMRMGAKA